VDVIEVVMMPVFNSFLLHRAAMHTFQKPSNPENDIAQENPQLRHSTIVEYRGIDKREGLIAIAKRLLRSVYHFTVSIYTPSLTWDTIPRCRLWFLKRVMAEEMARI
jgi:hypothetical protein